MCARLHGVARNGRTPRLDPDHPGGPLGSVHIGPVRRYGRCRESCVDPRQSSTVGRDRAPAASASRGSRSRNLRTSAASPLPVVGRRNSSKLLAAADLVFQRVAGELLRVRFMRVEAVHFDGPDVLVGDPVVDDEVDGDQPALSPVADRVAGVSVLRGADPGDLSRATRRKCERALRKSASLPPDHRATRRGARGPTARQSAGRDSR